jgi:hypothetical protein
MVHVVDQHTSKHLLHIVAQSRYHTVATRPDKLISGRTIEANYAGVSGLPFAAEARPNVEWQ